ncbi:hypothetical protein NP493_1262g00033 [Ridgeia piscesae]|uniref:Uncharacterized protein n=1 Tax=Ridgeia piscesae TaxID=27915 RepID=A0AAD9KAS4_RIDPI|nr:hypothetical protein NP493_1262g00033 [Ridgeia piscesae]
MVILPYVKGIKELVQLIQKHHEITTAVRPHRNLRKILVHPKDKVEDRSKTNCVYQIPWNTCDMSYISETGRTFGTRLDEHKKEVKTITTRRFTWEKRKWSTNVEHKLAITDRADRHNCVTDWEGRKWRTETDRCVRWIKDAIWIRKIAPTTNRYEEGYSLSHVWESDRHAIWRAVKILFLMSMRVKND